jgi:hypothetical protein
LGLINNRCNIAESRINQTSGLGTKNYDPATASRKLKYRAVKQSSTSRELTISTSQTITRLTGNILTDIKLDTAYQIAGIIKTHRLLRDLTGSSIDVIRLNRNAGGTDRNTCTDRVTTAHIRRTCSCTLHAETRFTGFIAGIRGTGATIITGGTAGNTDIADTRLSTVAPEPVITICISSALRKTGITCLVAKKRLAGIRSRLTCFVHTKLSTVTKEPIITICSSYALTNITNPVSIEILLVCTTYFT